ncbi:hypothetical protein RBB50_009641 [Rhinocladiella similis]
MDVSPRALSSPGRDSRADDEKSEGDCSSLSSLGLSPIVSPRRLRRPIAAGRRGRNVTSPVSATAGSDSGSDRVVPNEQASPDLIPSIDAIAGMRSLSTEFSACTNTQTPGEAGRPQTQDPAHHVSESVSPTSNGKSAEGSADLSSPGLECYEAEIEGHEVDMMEGEWLPTRSANASPSDEHIEQSDAAPAQDTQTQDLVQIDQETDLARQAMPASLELRLSSEPKTTTNTELKKLLRDLNNVKKERDQVAEENITLLIENERLTNELTEVKTASHNTLQKSLIRDRDLRLVEEAAEKAITEKDRSEASVVRLSEEIRKIKQENSKLDAELKSSSHEIWRLKVQLDTSERELQTFREAESSPNAPSNRLGRVEAEANKMMTWIKKEREQQSRLYPRLTYFHSRHLLTLLDETRAKRVRHSTLPSPTQFQSLGDVISTPSEAYPSNRQSMASQRSLPVSRRKHCGSTVALPPPTQTARTRSVQDCDPCRQHLQSYQRERAARTWTKASRDDKAVSIGRLQQQLSTIDIIRASLRRPPTRIPRPMSKNRTEIGIHTSISLPSLNATAQLSRQYHSQSEVCSPTVLKGNGQHPTTAAVDKGVPNLGSPRPEATSKPSSAYMTVGLSAIEGGFNDVIIASSPGTAMRPSPPENFLGFQYPLPPQTEGTGRPQIHPRIISPSISFVSSPMGTDQEMSRRTSSDTAPGVAHEASSSAVERLPQSPGLKKRFGNSPQASQLSPPRETEELDGSDVEASSSSQKGSELLLESMATQATPSNLMAENGAYGEQQVIIADEPGAPKNEKSAISHHQTLPFQQGNASPTELRHRRPYSWDGAVHQSPSPGTDMNRNNFKLHRPLNDVAMVYEETEIPGTVVDYTDLTKDTHSSVSSSFLYSGSVDASHVTSEAVQYGINDTCNDELPPAPSLASASPHSFSDSMYSHDLKAYQDDKLNTSPASESRVGWPLKNKASQSLLTFVVSSLNSFSDRLESAPCRVLETFFESGVASLGMSDASFVPELFELHLGDEGTADSASIFSVESWYRFGTRGDENHSRPASVGTGGSALADAASDQDGSHHNRGQHPMSGNHSESFVDGSTDSDLGLGVGRPAGFDNPHRFVSASPIQYCNVFDTGPEVERNLQPEFSSPPEGKPIKTLPFAQAYEWERLTQHESQNSHDSLLPSPLRPRAVPGTRTLSLHKSGSGSTQAYSSLTPNSPPAIRDRRPTYFLLAFFLVYIMLGNTFILMAYIAPLAIALPAALMSSVAWVLASVRTLTAMVICGRQPPVLPTSNLHSTSSMFIPPSSITDSASGGTMTLFEPATLSVPAPVSVPVPVHDRGPIRAGFPWTPFFEENDFVSVSSEGSFTSSQSPSTEEEEEQQEQDARAPISPISTCYISIPPASSSSSPSPSPLSSPTPHVESVADTNHASGEPVHESPTISTSTLTARTTTSKPRERERERGNRITHNPTQLNRAFAGPQYLDFAPSIRRFIDTISFDMTVMMIRWEETA